MDFRRRAPLLRMAVRMGVGLGVLGVGLSGPDQVHAGDDTTLEAAITEGHELAGTDAEAALRRFQYALTLDPVGPGSVESQEMIAEITRTQGRTRQAIVEFERLRDRTATLLRDLATTDEHFWPLRTTHKGALGKLIELYPRVGRHEDALLARKMLFDDRLPEGGHATGELLSTMVPYWLEQDAVNLRALGRFADALAAYDVAIRAYERALADPELLAAHPRFALRREHIVLLLRQKMAEVTRDHERARGAGPFGGRVYIEALESLWEDPQYREARPILKTGNDLALAYLLAGRDDEFVRVATDLVERADRWRQRPDARQRTVRARVLFTLAESEYGRRELVRAAVLYQRFLEEYADHELAADAVARLEEIIG